MTLRIDRVAGDEGTTIRLAGRVQAEHLDELSRQVGDGGPTVALDLDEVTLVDVDVVRFLGACQAAGTRVLHCSHYISDWIARERDRGA